MKLAVMIHQARLGPNTFRVIRPAQPLTCAVLIDHDRHLDAYLDQDSAQRIAGLWMLAARSPRSLIHLPMRANHTPAWMVPGDAGLQLDLVLLHHSLQFAPARWKQVRGQLDRGRPQTVSLPAAEHAGEPEIDYAARHYRENRDLFHQHLHAETLFMTGSAKVCAVRLDIATRLSTRLPGTLAALERGEIDLSKARAVVEATDPLTDEHAAAVQDQVRGRAGTQTAGQLRASLRRAVLRVDPEGACAASRRAA